MTQSNTSLGITHRSRRRLLGILFAAFVSIIASTVTGRVGWRSGGPDGGFITSIAVDPSNPSVLFVGTPIGIFKSVDKGSTWLGPTLSLPEPSLKQYFWVNAILVDPTDSDTVYAGVGDPAFPFGGAYKSRDGGISWTSIGVGLDSEDSAISALALSPSSPTTVFAGSYIGTIYRSDDGGTHWSTLGGLLALAASRINNIYPDPSDPQTIFAGGQGGAFKTSDGGLHWKALNQTLAWTSFAMTFSNPPTLYLGDHGGGGVQKSIDGGNTWKSVDNGFATYPLGLCDACIFPVAALIVDPSNPNHLIAGTEGDGVYESSDGAVHWARADLGLASDTRVFSLALATGQGGHVYIGSEDAGLFSRLSPAAASTPLNDGIRDCNVLAFASSTEPLSAFAATSGGVFRTSDAGVTWHLALATPSTTYFQGVWQHPLKAEVVFATDGYGNILRSGDNGTTWEVVSQGQIDEITQLAFDPADILHIIAPGSNFNNLPPSQLISHDGGETWQAGDGPGSIVFASVTPGTAYGIRGGLWKSTDGGGSWVQLNPTDTSGNGGCPYFTAIAIVPSTDTIIAGSSSYATATCESTDGGRSFHMLGATAEVAETLIKIIVNPNDTQLMLSSAASPGSCCAADHLEMSKDGGKSWIQIGADLPKVNITDIAMNASGETFSVATAGAGVFSISVSGGLIPTRIRPVPVQEPKVIQRRR